MRNVKPDWLSFTSVPIALVFSETETCLGKATGFFYEHNNKNYFITNWHNVTGIHPITRKPISTHGGSPDCIDMLLMTGITPAKWENYRIPIYTENKETGWLVHPIYKEKVDVVALEITFPKGFDGIVNPINKIPFRNDRLDVSDDVFIIGFPLNLLGGGAFPIWKRGSVATEPDMNFEDLPKFIVDTATRNGMSGSPVVMRKKGVHIYESSDDKVTIGLSQNFVGIYSGRLQSESETDAQLGIVWKTEVIEEIINGNLKCSFNIY